MRESSNSIETAERSGKLKKSGVVPQPITWSMTATADPHQAHNFETLLLAIAGHDLRQPLQILQSANELLGLGPRTSSELRLLRSGQDAIDRLKEQLAQLVTALPFRERTEEARLAPVHVGQVIRQVRRDNEETALKKGIFIRSVPSDALVLSDRLLLSAALHNLVSNAVKYTQPGGRIVLGCRNVGSFIRLDVYDNGIGIPSDQVPKAFEALPASMLRDATASASACSSFARQSGFLDTASTSFPLHVGDLVSPFSSAVRRRRIAIEHERLRTSLSTREYGHEIRTGESQDTCRSVEMRGVSPSGGERLFARSLYSKAVLRSGVLPRMEWNVPPLRPYAEINPFELIFEWQESTSDIVSTLFGLG